SGAEPYDAPWLLARSSARLRTTGDCADRQPGRLSVQLRDLRRQPRRCDHHGKHSAHGGTQVWEGAAHLGDGSGHCEGGESRSHSQTQWVLLGGYTTPTDEAV